MPNKNRSAVAKRLADTKRRVAARLLANTYTTALAMPAFADSAPVTDAATGRLVIETEDFPVARVFFGGSDAENEAFNYQAILWYPSISSPSGWENQGWLPIVVAGGVATLGKMTLPTWIEATNGFFADTITDTVASGLDGVDLVVNTDGCAFIEIPVPGAAKLEVQVELGTAASSDILIQLGE